MLVNCQGGSDHSEGCGRIWIWGLEDDTELPAEFQGVIEHVDGQQIVFFYHSELFQVWQNCILSIAPVCNF